MSAAEAANRGYRHRTFPGAPCRCRCATKVFDAKSRRGATQMRRFCGIILAVVLSIASIAAGLADPAPPAGVPTEDGMRAFALQWFAQMQAGKINRTQYTAAYGAQLTDD